MEAIIFTGIQASGKSEFYLRNFFQTHIRINLDMLKTRHREKLILKACLEAKQSFVVDNTNPSIESRAIYIQLAKAANFEVVSYYFHTSAADSIERNQKRQGTARVPNVAIFTTQKKLEIPCKSEGFDRLYQVEIESRQFVVTAVPGEAAEEMRG